MLERRPSDNELLKRLNEAKNILRISDGLFASPAKAVDELYKLEIDNSKEIWNLIGEKRRMLNEMLTL